MTKSSKDSSVISTLGEVLHNTNEFNAAHFLYLPMDEVWQADTKCAVLAQSDLDGVPEVAQENGLSYALGIAGVQDSIVNAKEQVANLNIDQLLQAFLFYYDHDAFITFSNPGQ